MYVAPLGPESLHLGHLTVDAGDCGLPYLHEQLLGALDILGHHVVGHVVGIVLEAEDVGLADASLQNFGDYGVVVVFAR